jgi:hypothetical protein
MSHAYSYAAALAASEKVRWRVEDLIGGERRLDFSRPFLPESLAQVTPLAFLTPAEQTALNQVRAHEYLCMFGIVEEFILPFLLDHARPQLSGDDARVRALLQFAGEEAKHIHLFKRFREEFEKGFGTRCEVIGPPEAVGREVLAHDPLAVALVILQIEWMTQRHFEESVRDDRGLDPQFASLLRHHWMEEAQHAKLDTLVVEALAAGRTPERVRGAVEEYLAIGGFLDQGLATQVDLNLASFEAATGRVLTPSEREDYATRQRRALRWTYLGSGMTHPRFVETLRALDPQSGRRVAEVAPAFS